MAPKSSAFENSPEIKQYFDSLPAFIQETVMQSGVQIETEEQLRQCAEKLMKKDRTIAVPLQPME